MQICKYAQPAPRTTHRAAHASVYICTSRTMQSRAHPNNTHDAPYTVCMSCAARAVCANRPAPVHLCRSAQCTARCTRNANRDAQQATRTGTAHTHICRYADIHITHHAPRIAHHASSIRQSASRITLQALGSRHQHALDTRHHVSPMTQEASRAAHAHTLNASDNVTRIMRIMHTMICNHQHMHRQHTRTRVARST